MSINNLEKIEQARRSIATEQNKTVPDQAVIARFEQVIVEAEKAQIQAEKIIKSDFIESQPPAPSQAEKERAQREAAVFSSGTFLEKEEVKQVAKVSNALSDGEAKIEVTKNDIDTMNANANAIVADPKNQEEHKQRQEEAKKLKEELKDPNLSAEDKKEKEGQQAAILEAIGEFKGAEAKVQRQVVLQDIKKGVSLKKTPSPDSASSKDFLEKEEVKQVAKTSNALSDGEAKVEVTKSDIDTMNVDAQTIVAAPKNQEGHKQRQEEAKKLKEELKDPDLSAEDKKEKEGQQAATLEAVGEFKGAEAKVQRQAVLQDIKQGVSLRKTSSPDSASSVKTPKEVFGKDIKGIEPVITTLQEAGASRAVDVSDNNRGRAASTPPAPAVQQESTVNR